MKKLFLPLLVALLTLTSCYKEETIILVFDDESNGFTQVNPSEGGNNVGFRLVPSTTSSKDLGGSTLTFSPYTEKGASLVNSNGRSTDSDFPVNFSTANSPLAFDKDGTTRYDFDDVNYNDLGNRTFNMVSGTYSYRGSCGDNSALQSNDLPFTLLENQTFTLPTTNVVDLRARTNHSIVTVNDVSTGGVFGTPQIAVGTSSLGDMTASKNWNGDNVNYAYVLSGNSLELSLPWSVVVSGTMYSGTVTRVISNVATYTHYAYNLDMEIRVLEAGQVSFTVVFENPFTLNTETVTATQIIDPTTPTTGGTTYTEVIGQVSYRTVNGNRYDVTITFNQEVTVEAGDVIEVLDSDGSVVYSHELINSHMYTTTHYVSIGNTREAYEATEIGMRIRIRRG